MTPQRGFIAAALLAVLIATPVHAADPVRGKMLYENTNGAPLSCALNGCHGPNPNTNTNNVKSGANAPNVILNAINGGVGVMGFLVPYVSATDAADMAAYIANPAAGTPSPAATLSTATLSFGSQVVQTTSGAMSASLTNTGSANLVLSAITLGGTNPTDFTRGGTCAVAASLAPNASCSIDITFKPTATGARGATVTIGHNASPSTSMLTLTGTGAAAPTPAVGLSATTLAFGNQTLGIPSAPKTVTITNTGTANLLLGTIASTGTNAADFTSAGCAGTTLVAGANCSVSVTFTPTALNSRNANLSIASNASGSPHGVALTGNGVAAPAPAVNLNPASLAFGNQTVGTTSAAKSIALTNSGNAALGISSIAVTGGGFASSHNCPASLVAGGSCTISVSFAPTSAVAVTGAVTISSAATGSPHTVGLSGTGTVPTPTAPIATLTPLAVDFGMVTLNTPSATRLVSLTNTGNAPLNLSAVNVGGANAGEFSQTSNCPVGGALAAGANCTISARFTPAAAGARVASLTLASNAAGSPTVSLTGTGIVQASGLAQISPTQAKFGRVRLGTTSDERTVRVRNFGTSPLLVSSVSISGEFLQQNDCTGSLAVGATCEVKVRFKPTVLGVGVGELTIGSNAAGAPHSVKLTGTAVTRASREKGERGDHNDVEDGCDDEDKCSQAILPFTPRRRRD